MGVLDEKIFAYLQRVRNNEVPETDRAAQRLSVATDIATEWSAIINNFDTERQTDTPSILEQYQKSLGVYKLPQDYNYLGNMRYYGWTLASIAVLSSLLMAVGVFAFRKNRIVRASQRETSLSVGVYSLSR